MIKTWPQATNGPSKPTLTPTASTQCQFSMFDQYYKGRGALFVQHTVCILSEFGGVFPHCSDK
jgi:hypothetical protein